MVDALRLSTLPEPGFRFSGLAKDRYVGAGDFDRPAHAIGDEGEGGFAVEHYVRGVATVVPVDKASVVGLENGHHAQVAAGSEQGVKAPEFIGGAVHVLD